MLPNYKEKMAQAYDFALDKMGMDIASYPIWNDYVTFLKNVEAVGSYAENQKIMAIRKVYHRGVINPMINIENLWKNYVVFEQGINPILAEKMTNERSRDYMNARRVAKEYEACTRGLNKSTPCVPPTGTQDELKQVEVWQNYIAWERSNPLRVEDQALITKRVMFAYEQALLCLGHHPNIWYEAAVYLQESSKQLAEKGDVDASKMYLDQASTMYERAKSSVLKNSLLLHFAYADFEEQQMRFEKVNQIYQSYLEIKEIDPTLCYIQYMKFSHRTEGKNASRLIFKKAREDPRVSHHVFVAAALMEYYCTKDQKIASNVFELGFKRYKANEEYILAYIDYLSHLNEDNNTRVLFERALSSGSLKAEQQIDIWNKFLEFEANIGDMTTIIKVAQRRAQALEQEFGEMSATSQLIDRYKFLELYPCSKDELTILGYKAIGSQKIPHGMALSKEILPIQANGVGPSVVTDHDTVTRPDTGMMTPFKPKVKWIPGEHRVPGGGFPMPPAAAELCQNLPPPQSFQGPFVVVDRLMELFTHISLPDKLEVAESNGHSTKQFETARSTTWAVDNGPQESRKRKSGGAALPAGGGAGGGADESDDDSSNISAPINDIYRKRQQKRMR
ncbi:cleavage stimulation factor subunit 3-like isoform X2 [Tigriopus californicus]|nr:cleavage stimulation factor subunit 3-like isoform X2 [Tigriopus californicus]